METTKLSSRGQVVLPNAVRLRAKVLFPQTELKQASGSVSHAGPAKTIEAMDAGIRTAVARRYHRAVKR